MEARKNQEMIPVFQLENKSARSLIMVSAFVLKIEQLVSIAK